MDFQAGLALGEQDKRMQHMIVEFVCMIVGDKIELIRQAIRGPEDEMNGQNDNCMRASNIVNTTRKRGFSLQSCAEFIHSQNYGKHD